MRSAVVRRGAIAALFSVLGVAVGAHPHMSLSSKLTFEYEAEKCRAISLEWTFDPYFSASIIGEHDIDKNGRFNPQETKNIHDFAFSNLRKYGFFLYIRSGRTRFNPTAVQNFAAEIREDRLVYRFSVDLSERDLGADFGVAVFDSTYFCAVSYPKDAATVIQRVSGAPVPAWERVIDKRYPVYYDPNQAATDMTPQTKWRAGLETAYPEEIRAKF